jgi:transglutaminase-like putative cysteine protease
VALFEYVRDHIRYIKDPVGVESVSDPYYTLARMVGDCDDQAVLLAALYESVGFPTRFVIAGYNGADVESFAVKVGTRF